MIYFADEAGRPSGKTADMTMADYAARGIIPDNATEQPPLPPKDGFEVVLSGFEWKYFEIET